MSNSNVVDITIKIDSSIYKELSKIKQQLNDIATNNGIEENLTKQFNVLSSKVDEIQKKMGQKLGVGGLAQTSSQIEDLKTGFTGLVAVARKISETLGEMKAPGVEETKKTIDDLIESLEKGELAFDSMQEAAAKGVGNKSNLLRDTATAINNAITGNGLDQYSEQEYKRINKKFDLSDVSEVKAKLNKQYAGLKKTIDEFYQYNPGTPEYLTSLQNATKQANSFAANMSAALDSDEFYNKIAKNDTDYNWFDSITRGSYKTVDSFISQLKAQKSQVQAEIQEIGKEIQPEYITKKGKGGTSSLEILYPVHIKVEDKASDIFKAVSTVVDEAARQLKGKEITIPLNFQISGYSKRQTAILNQISKQLSEGVEGLSAEERAKFDDLVGSAGGNLGQQLTFNMKSSLRDTSSELKTFINQMQAELKTNPLELRGTLSEQSLADMKVQLQALIDDWRKDLSKIFFETTDGGSESLQTLLNNMNELIAPMKRFVSMSNELRKTISSLQAASGVSINTGALSDLFSKAHELNIQKDTKSLNKLERQFPILLKYKKIWQSNTGYEDQEYFDTEADAIAEYEKARMSLYSKTKENQSIFGDMVADSDVKKILDITDAIYNLVTAVEKLTGVKTNFNNLRELLPAINDMSLNGANNRSVLNEIYSKYPDLQKYESQFTGKAFASTEEANQYWDSLASEISNTTAVMNVFSNMGASSLKPSMDEINETINKVVSSVDELKTELQSLAAVYKQINGFMGVDTLTNTLQTLSGLNAQGKTENVNSILSQYPFLSKYKETGINGTNGWGSGALSVDDAKALANAISEADEAYSHYVQTQTKSEGLVSKTPVSLIDDWNKLISLVKEYNEETSRGKRSSIGKQIKSQYSLYKSNGGINTYDDLALEANKKSKLRKDLLAMDESSIPYQGDIYSELRKQASDTMSAGNKYFSEIESTAGSLEGPVSKIVGTLGELRDAMEKLQEAFGVAYDSDGNVKSLISMISESQESLSSILSDNLTSKISGLAESLSKIFTSGGDVAGTLKAFSGAATAYNKLVSSLGESGANAKVKQTVDNLNLLRKAMSGNVSASGFIQGLNSLATIMTSTTKQVNAAKEAISEQKGMQNSADIEAKAKKYVSDNFDGNLYYLKTAVSSKGIPQITAYLEQVVQEGEKAKTVLKEVNLAFNGSGFAELGTSENSRNAIRIYRTQQSMKDYQEAEASRAENITDQYLLNPVTDKGEWEYAVNEAKQYADILGEIVSITRQVRQDSKGNALVSYSVNGANGHYTFGPNSKGVASNQTLFDSDLISSGYSYLNRNKSTYFDLASQSGKNLNSAQKAFVERYKNMYNTLAEQTNRITTELGGIGNEALSAKNQFDLGFNIDYSKRLTKQIDDFNNKLQKAQYTRQNQKSGFTPEYEERINNIKSNIAELQQINKQISASGTVSVDDLRTASQYIDKIRNDINDIGLNENVLAPVNQVSKALSRIDDFINKNNLSGSVKTDAEAIRTTLQGVVNEAQAAHSEVSSMSKDELKSIQSQVEMVMAQGKSQGMMGSGMFRQISKNIGYQVSSFFATFFGMYDIIRYAQELFSAVQETNSALIELQKVSDATNSRLQESFRTSAETAQELGASLNDVINSTSSWAKLGRIRPLYVVTRI